MLTGFPFQSITGFLQSLGSGELLLIFFIVLLLFGAKRLPELAQGLGKAMREFKKASNEVEDNFREVMENPSPVKPAPAKDKIVEPLAPAQPKPVDKL